METRNRTALLALAAAGALWGLTVPLTKLALEWLGPASLTAVRFAAAAPLLAFAGRRGIRDALRPGIVTAGAIGFGAVVALQNAGIARTSVSHAALLVGAVPVLVALIASGTGEPVTRRLTWSGYVLALLGIALIARAGGGGATALGDGLMLGSVVLSAGFIAAQPRLLAGRDVAAVTAVQFAAGALVATPIALVTDASPSAPAHIMPVLAVAALTLAGTVLAFWLFAFGQARVPAHLAGTFVNLEPVVGAAAGWFAFGDPAATLQVIGAAAVLSGIAVSALPPRSELDGSPPQADRPPSRPRWARAGSRHIAAQAVAHASGQLAAARARVATLRSF